MPNLQLTDCCLFVNLICFGCVRALANPRNRQNGQLHRMGVKVGTKYSPSLYIASLSAFTTQRGWDVHPSLDVYHVYPPTTAEVGC